MSLSISITLDALVPALKQCLPTASSITTALISLSQKAEYPASLQAD